MVSLKHWCGNSTSIQSRSVTELETNGELISTSRWKWNAVCSIMQQPSDASRQSLHCGQGPGVWNTYIQGGLVFEGGGNYCIFTLMNEPRVFPYIAWNLCLICTMSTSARETITRVRVRSSVPRPYRYRVTLLCYLSQGSQFSQVNCKGCSWK